MNERLKAINGVLLALLGSLELVQRWWLSPNVSLQLKCPQEVWDSGDEGKDEVESYVMTHGYR